MSVLVFIYSDREDVMDDLPGSCAGGMFTTLVPLPLTYSVYNLLVHYDTDGIVEKEKPLVIVACGAEAAECLRFDGYNDIVIAPDITNPQVSRKKCMAAARKIQDACTRLTGFNQ